MALLNGQKLMERLKFTGQGVGGPARPQGLDTVPDETVPLQEGVPRCHKHWEGSHFTQEQSPFE